MNLTDFDALSFDCYGTLIDWETGLSEVLVPWARRGGVTASAEELLEAYASVEAEVEASHPAWPYPQVLAECLRRLGASLGAPVTSEDESRLAGSVPDWPAFPDSPDALAALGEHHKLIILSNVDRASFAGSNRRLGVTFTSILTAEDIGSYKPSPRNFEALLAEARRLGVDRLLHAAQSLFHDHVPAKQAGLATVWINRRHGRSGSGATPLAGVSVTPDWEFPSMAAFAAAVG
jgi:2-haloalkanoic acid dehalogenase type II